MLADFSAPIARPFGDVDPVAVALTADELMASFVIAFNRNANGQRLKNFAQRRGNDLELHQQGAQAEIAVMQYLGLEFSAKDLILWSRSMASVRSADVTLNEWTIEVKAVRFYPPMLKFFKNQRFDKDFAILCLSRGGGLIDIYAAISRARFSQIAVLRKSKDEHEPCHSVYLQEMTPVAEFRDWITTHRPDPRDRRRAVRIEPKPEEQPCVSPTSLKAEASSEASASSQNTSTGSTVAATTPS